MDALILEQDPRYQIEWARALMRRGMSVVCVDTIGAAESFLRVEPPRALIMGERVGGRLSHSVALLGECRNPDIAAILLTDRAGAEVSELFDLIPAIRAILGRGVDPETLGQIVMSAVAPDAAVPVGTRQWARPVAQGAVARADLAQERASDAAAQAAAEAAGRAAQLAAERAAERRERLALLLAEAEAAATAPLPVTAPPHPTAMDVAAAQSRWIDAARPSPAPAAPVVRQAVPAMAAALAPFAAEAGASLAAITAAPQVSLGPAAPGKPWPSLLVRRQVVAPDPAESGPRVVASGGGRRITLG